METLICDQLHIDEEHLLIKSLKKSLVHHDMLVFKSLVKYKM